MSFLETYPWFVPGVLASAVVAGLAGRRLARALSLSSLLGFLLAAELGVVVSATLLPGTPGSVGSGTCDLTRLALPTWSQLIPPGEILFNILLFVPLGALIALLPASPYRLVVVALACVSPFAIEAIQLVALPLGRECQSGDVIDNATGLTIGVLAVAALRGLAAASKRRNGPPPPASAPPRPGIATLAVLGLAGVLVLAAAALPPGQLPPPSGTTPTSGPGASAPPGSGEPQPSNGASPASVVRVSSVPALLAALAKDHVTEIIVADGRYRVSPAGRLAADSLWIGSTFASRTHPVLVRAETPGGVTFDGGGATGFGGLRFSDGAHHQTWDGFVFANGSPTRTGVIFFGEGSDVAPHDITLRHITIDATVIGTAVDARAPATDHAIYISDALGGPHDLVFEDITVDGRGGLASAFHFFHSSPPLLNASRVTVRRLEVVGTQQAIMLWDSTLREITFDTVRIRDALKSGVTYEALGARDIVLSNVTTTGSGSGIGFQSSGGPAPAGLTLINTSFH